MWLAGSFILLALLAYGALRFALWQNPHAVLDTVDKIVGGSHTVEKVHEASTGPQPQQRLIVLREKDAGTALPVFVFFHGGSWSHGDPADYGFVARNLAPEGYIVVLGGYRLGEAGRYPAMLEDTASVIAWVHANIATFGGDPEKIFVGGHSAGAYNVAQVALEPRWLERAGAPADAIRGVVGLAGPYDFYPFDSDSTRAAFGSVGVGPISQPVTHVRSDAPPMLLIHGALDTLVKPRNSRTLSARLEEAGSRTELLILPDGDHNAPLLRLASPWRRETLVHDKIAAFLSRNTDNKQVSVPVQPRNP